MRFMARAAQFAIRRFHRAFPSIDLTDHVVDEFMRVAYSQEGEDLLIGRLLGGRKAGFYVDVGAHHPVRFSNTYLLYKKGWRGINIDASRELVAAFASTRPRDISISCLVGKDGAEHALNVYAEQALNTIMPPNASLGVPIETRSLVARSLASILDEHVPSGQRIDLLNIDVEGAEFGVLESNDWDRYAPDFIMMEQPSYTIRDMLKGDTVQFLLGLRYEPVAKLHSTAIFERR